MKYFRLKDLYEKIIEAHEVEKLCWENFVIVDVN